jgi:hypothetical protein
LTRQLYRDFGVSLDFAEGSFGNLVSAIRFDHRRGPMVRATAWLRRVRDSAQLRGTRRQQACVVRESRDDRSAPDGVRRPDNGLGPPLLPCHLPPRPAYLQPEEGRRRPHRRRARRWRDKALAWELTEAQVGAFVFWECGCPKSAEELREKLGPWRIGPAQEAAFHQLLAENLSMCRPFACASTPALGRGLQRMRNVLTQYENEWKSDPGLAHELKGLAVTGAKPVDPGRVAICDPAATCLPEAWLREDRRKEYLDWQGRVKEEAGEMPLPKFCYRVAATDEVELRLKLLRSGMAGLVPESEIPLTSLGELLLGGMFGVDHKVDVDRLIYDRRPQNAKERRLGWARLPVGAQLGRIVLDRGEVLRASGDDIRTYFFRLKNIEGTEHRNCVGRQIDGSEVTEFGGIPGVKYRMGLRIVGMGDLNAVDVAHCTHQDLLIHFGCMDPTKVVELGRVMPDGNVYELLYIDDHIRRPPSGARKGLWLWTLAGRWQGVRRHYLRCPGDPG